MKQTEEEGHPAPPLSVGFTYELCAGIVDKSQSLKQIAAEEVYATHLPILSSCIYCHTAYVLRSSCSRHSSSVKSNLCHK